MKMIFCRGSFKRKRETGLAVLNISGKFCARLCVSRVYSKLKDKCKSHPTIQSVTLLTNWSPIIAKSHISENVNLEIYLLSLASLELQN